MREFEEFAKTVSLGMKALAKIIEAAADQLEEHVPTQSKPDQAEETPTSGKKKGAAQGRPKKDAPEAMKPAEELPLETKTRNTTEPAASVIDTEKTSRKQRQKPKTSKPSSPEPMRQSDTQTVYLRIQAAGIGVSLDELQKDTGFHREKLYNIVYRLKKSGKIKTSSEGLYSAA